MSCKTRSKKSPKPKKEQETDAEGFANPTSNQQNQGEDKQSYEKAKINLSEGVFQF